VKFLVFFFFRFFSWILLTGFSWKKLNTSSQIKGKASCYHGKTSFAPPFFFEGESDRSSKAAIRLTFAHTTRCHALFTTTSLIVSFVLSNSKDRSPMMKKIFYLFHQLGGNKYPSTLPYILTAILKLH